MTRVPRCELAPDLSVSRLLTGLWQIADMEREGGPVDPLETARAMEPYVEAGLTTFDMADHYGSAELVAGRFRSELAGDRRVELLTKWVPEPGPRSRDEVRAAVQRSLDRLGVERLDLLQYHAWRYADPSWLDQLLWLDELRREGLIGRLGLTNFDADHLDLVLHSGIEVVSNQVCFSLLDRRPLGRMTDVCARHGVKLLAFGTLAGGLLTERWLGAPEPGADELGTWSEMKYARFVEAAGGWAPFQRLLHAMASVAERLGVSMANVAARWVLEQPAVAGVIVGARLGRSRHVEDNLRVFDFELGEDARRELDEALAGLRAIPGDSGDEYRRPPFLTASGDLSHHLDAFPPPYPVEEVRDETGEAVRLRASSGTPWEGMAGYGRAVRVGERILVSGTTATHGDRVVGGDDPGAQAVFCLDKIQGAVEALGGRLEDVVRTRIFVADAEEWEPVARAHGRRFGHVRPANTLVEARLVGAEYRVEIEAEAVVGSGGPGPGGAPGEDGT